MKLRKILGDTAFSSLRVLLTLLRGIILIPIITKFLGETAYGHWVILIAIVSVASSVGGLHLHGALIRYTPREDQKGQTLVDILSLGVAAAAIFSALVYLTVKVIGFAPDIIYSETIAIALSLLVAGRILILILKNYPRSHNRVKEFEIITIFQLILENLALAITLWHFRSLVAAIWVLVAIVFLLSGLLATRYLPRKLLVPNVSRFGQYLRYSIPMVPKATSSRVLTNADKFLITIFISPGAVAIYAVSFSIASLLRNLTNPLNPTLYPAVASAWDEGDYLGVQDLYHHIFRVYTLIGIPAVVGITILSEPLLLIVSTEQIASQGRYLLPALAVGFFFRGYDNPMAYVFNAAEENTILAKIIISAVIINVGLNLILIPSLEIFGAVIATFVSNFLITGCVYTFVKGKIKIRFPHRVMLRSSFATLLMGTVLIFQPFSLSATIKLGFYPLIGLLVYSIGLLLSGELSIGEVISAYRKIKSGTSGENR